MLLVGERRSTAGRRHTRGPRAKGMIGRIVILLLLYGGPLYYIIIWRIAPPAVIRIFELQLKICIHCPRPAICSNRAWRVVYDLWGVRVYMDTLWNTFHLISGAKITTGNKMENGRRSHRPDNRSSAGHSLANDIFNRPVLLQNGSRTVRYVMFNNDYNTNATGHRLDTKSVHGLNKRGMK